MVIDGSKMRTKVSFLGLAQAGLCVALADKLSRNMRIASAAVSAFSGLSLGLQLYASREQKPKSLEPKLKRGPSEKIVLPPPTPDGLMAAILGRKDHQAGARLEIGDRMFHTIQGSELSQPVMTGSDHFERPFIVLRFTPKNLEEWLVDFDDDERSIYREKHANGELQLVAVIYYAHSPKNNVNEGPPGVWNTTGWGGIFKHPTLGKGLADPLENSGVLLEEVASFIRDGGNKDYELV